MRQNLEPEKATIIAQIKIFDLDLTVENISFKSYR
jgi:hypothetical protein